MSSICAETQQLLTSDIWEDKQKFWDWLDERVVEDSRDDMLKLGIIVSAKVPAAIAKGHVLAHFYETTWATHPPRWRRKLTQCDCGLAPEHPRHFRIKDELMIGILMRTCY